MHLISGGLRKSDSWRGLLTIRPSSHQRDNDGGAVGGGRGWGGYRSVSFASLLIQVTVFGVGLYFYLYKPHQDIENLVNTVNGD